MSIFGNRMSRRVALALGIALAVLAQSAAAAGLQTLRDLWRDARNAAEYGAVARSLIEYRTEARYAKTAEVDYMIATSLCRVPETETDGFRHFDWILASYDLGPDRDKVLEERDNCKPAAAKPTQVTFAMLPGQGGAAEVRSKLYYWIGREAAAVNTEPVEIVSAKTPEELRGRLFGLTQHEAAVAAGKSRVGPGFEVVAAERFVLVSSSGHTQGELNEVAANLERFFAFFRAAYKLRPPEHLVTVYLVPSVADLSALAEKLHGIRVPSQSIGYSFRDDLSILAVIPGQAIGTLAHELFHVMVRDSHGDLPPWLEEGAAALYEVSNVSAKYLPGGPGEVGSAGVPMVGGKLAVRGVANWRGCVLQKIWLEGYGPTEVRRPTISELIGMDWRAFNNLEGDELAAQQAVIHATARYFLLYLQDVEQKLFPVFATFALRNPFEIKLAPSEDAKMRLARELGDLTEADGAFETWLRQTILPQHEC